MNVIVIIYCKIEIVRLEAIGSVCIKMFSIFVRFAFLC